MEILNKVAIVGCNEILLTAGVITLCVGAVGVLITMAVWNGMGMWASMRNDGRMGVIIWIAFAVFVAGLVCAGIGAVSNMETGCYQYTARITDEAIVADLYDRYDNVEFESDNIVTFESKNPALEHQYGSSDAVTQPCSACGNELNDNDKFCANCGIKVNEE